MLAHMNAEALERTLATGVMHYWSRSRQSLWRKGDTSGQVQTVVETQGRLRPGRAARPGRGRRRRRGLPHRPSIVLLPARRTRRRRRAAGAGRRNVTPLRCGARQTRDERGRNGATGALDKPRPTLLAAKRALGRSARREPWLDDLLRKTEAETASGGRRRAEPRIGLALGAGAARGWAHIGALRELAAMGLVPDVVVGSSIGALVGGCFAAGRLDEIEDLRPLAQPAARVRPDRLLLQRRRPDRRRSAARPIAGIDRIDANRGPADPLRRRGDRTRHRARGLAAPRLADRGDARVLRPARRVRAGQDRPIDG